MAPLLTTPPHTDMQSYDVTLGASLHKSAKRFQAGFLCAEVLWGLGLPRGALYGFEWVMGLHMCVYVVLCVCVLFVL